MASFGALPRALATRDSKLFFAGSMVAWTGLWMQRIAVSWLAWELTGSSFWVGMVAFCDLAPAVLISPIAGAIADRMDRVKLTMWTQVALAFQALAVASITYSGHMTIAILLALEVVNGIASSFAQPARQTLMPGIVARADLPAAVAANSLCFAVARFTGPGIAGPVIAAWGVVPAISCNAVGYVFACVTIALLRVDARERRGHPASPSLWREVIGGLRYAARHPGLGPLFLYAALGAVLMRGVQEILPPYVEWLFGRGAESLALLTACFGVGALIAGLWVASRGRLAGTTRLAIFAALAQAASIAGFVATGWFPLGMLCAALIGATASIHGISVQTLVQSSTDTAYRGRMLSLWGLISRACPAVGALVLGGAGEWFGLRLPTLVATALFLGVFAWGLTRLKQIERDLEGEGSSAANR